MFSESSGYTTKVVLVSERPYTPERDEALLRGLIQSQVELFCVMGCDAKAWEEAMDWLCIRADECAPHFMLTTSHPDESLEEVLEFAAQMETSSPATVTVLTAWL